MPPEVPEFILPTEPGLHLVVDKPQGPGAPLLADFAFHALNQGIPVVCILLDQAVPQFRQVLIRRGLDVATLEEQHLIAYVDAHAPRVGWAHTAPATVFVEKPGPDNLLIALSEAESIVTESAPWHLILVDSFSTLLILEGLPPTYAFAQALGSLAPRLGAVTVGRVTAGMHRPEEIVALTNIATTVTDVSGEISLRREVEEPGKKTREFYRG